MKKIVLCGINASFSHSSLSLLCLKYSAGAKPELIEFSINDSVQVIVRELVLKKPDVMGFSCYIWNIEHVLKTASSLKKILPDCFIILGGPEVSYDSEAIMREYGFIDIIIRGYGEIPFKAFCESLESESGIENVPSACIRTAGGIITTPQAPEYDMSQTPFMYGDIEYFKNKLIYYETSRGCPFNCAYCMSANTGTSFLPLDRVKEELEFFFKKDVMKVKFVDRTFNYPPNRAYSIIETIITLSDKYPHARTGFHLEITASLLDEKMLELLHKARKGLIQVEVGIQSTNPETLRAVNRGVNMESLLNNIGKLCRMENIHVHADLIAGLPFETYKTFRKTFNDSFYLRPDALQLGFLKVLKGSRMRDEAERYGIVYSDYAPYEVLSTNTMPYDELSRLHNIENILNLLYNSGMCLNTLKYTLSSFESPFDFFEKFSLYLNGIGYFKSPKKNIQLFEELYKFFIEAGCEKDTVKESLALDWLKIDKPGKWPFPIEPDYTESEKKKIRCFFEDPDNIKKYLPGYFVMPAREISKRCYLFIARKIFPAETAVLFDYGKDNNEICLVLHDYILND